MLKNKIKLSYFVLIISISNLFLYHLPVYQFTINNLNYEGFDRAFTIISIAILLVSLNALFFYIALFISRFIGKSLLILFFNINDFFI